MSAGRSGSTALIDAHLRALTSLAQRLVRDRTGGVLEAALEALQRGLSARGALAYRVEDDALVLAADIGLPVAARKQLAHLPLDSSGNFVAQRAARELRAALEQGTPQDSAHAALVLGGWLVLAATPMTMGRTLRGVLVVGLDAPARLGTDGLALCEAVAALATLSIEHEESSQRDRDERGADELAARLATVGMVSTAGALDIAVPLSAMMVQLEALERALSALRGRVSDPSDELDDAEELAGDMGEGLRHALGIASHQLELSRKSRPGPVDLTHALDAALALLRGKLDATAIVVRVSGDDHPLLVDGRVESLHTLIVQVLLHALELTSTAGAREGGISIELSSDGARHVMRIETATADPKRRRAFDAFVKRQLRGPAVLSLSLAAQAVVAHEGHIEIGTSARGGARISVVLPASRTLPPVRGRFTTDPPLGQTIVIIGDDDDLVESLSVALPNHRILVARDLAEGYDMLASMRPLPDMVLCEVILPDGTGTELHQSVEPTLRGRFVFTTKGVLPADVADYLRGSSCPTLLRPIAPDEIRMLLSDDSATGAPTLGGRARRDTEPHVSIPPHSAARDKRSKRSAERRRTTTQTDTPEAKIRSKPPTG
jgi:signal transduction histidine kinase